MGANAKVDQYLREGCGRCPLGGTPACRVNDWREELKALRQIAIACGLIEDVKWSVPCYTIDGKNVVIISALKDCCTISFFKGALLKDPQGLLTKPGENTQAGRIIRFTSVQEIANLAPIVKAYISEAVEVEKAGQKAHFKQEPEPVPEELERMLAANPALRSAFEALTPGRQRGYILYFTAAKQPKTREARIEKCTPNILAGKGLHDR